MSQEHSGMYNFKIASESVAQQQTCRLREWYCRFLFWYCIRI